MKIHELQCDQFAGLKSRTIGFMDGMNLVIGANESGKSTLIDLMDLLFFQSTEIDGRRDRDFKDLYFPKSTGNYRGDVIDGAIRFETEEGMWLLRKEWSGKVGSSRLTAPDGTVLADRAKIEEALLAALSYGRGVYEELVFASQRRPRHILSDLFGNAAASGMHDLSAAITRAVMETGGLDLDSMEAELKATLASYAGRWDFDADLPENGRKRGIRNRWKQGGGSILEAFYGKEEIAEAWRRADAAEREVDRLHGLLQEAKRQREELSGKRERFAVVRTRISARESERQLVRIAEKECAEMQAASGEWPDLLRRMETAGALKTELAAARNMSLYREVRQLVLERDAAEAELRRNCPIEEETVREAERLEAGIPGLSAALTGMDLSIRLKRLGEEKIYVKSALTGETLYPEEDGAEGAESAGTTADLQVREAVSLVIPEVAEIGLSRSGVDVDALQEELADAKDKLARILDAHGADSAAALRGKKREADRLLDSIRMLTARIDAKLGGAEWDALRSEVEADRREPEEAAREVRDIEADIREIAGSASLDAALGRMEAERARLESLYGSPEKLAERLHEKQTELAERRERLAAAEEVPEEFAAVEDADAYDRSLKDQVFMLDQKLERLGGERSEAEKVLGDKTSEEYAEEYARAEEIFSEKKTEYRHWKHIADTFARIKGSFFERPMRGVAEAFAGNLRALTGGDIVLEGLGDDLRASVVSGSSRLAEGILSEGTKDTIDLAFRLAVLDALFPDGGCTAVFDDPFTEMDPRRTEAACALLQKFAERNQVIFVTCDEKYRTMLRGHVMMVER